MKKLLLLLVVISSMAVTAQESVLLRLNYNQGDQYLIEMQTVTNSGAQGGMTMAMKMNMEIAEVTEDQVLTKSTVDQIIMNMIQGGMTMNYDSSTPVEELSDIGKMMKPQMDPMLEAVINTTFNKKGEVVEMKVEPFVNGMDQMNSNTIAFPEEPVSVGSSWTGETENNGLKTVSTYTVTSIADGYVVLDIAGDVSGIGTGTVAGTSKIEIATGNAEDTTTEVSLAAQGMETKVTVNLTMIKAE